jgi:uncharacterized Zn finger protein
VKIPFDITDGRNRYAPCPGCGHVCCAGVITHGGMSAIECLNCHHRGPEFPYRVKDVDLKMYEAWWRESSTTMIRLLQGVKI